MQGRYAVDKSRFSPSIRRRNVDNSVDTVDIYTHIQGNAYALRLSSLHFMQIHSEAY